jgi:bifunctional DNase/RNase
MVDVEISADGRPEPLVLALGIQTPIVVVEVAVDDVRAEEENPQDEQDASDDDQLSAGNCVGAGEPLADAPGDSADIAPASARSDSWGTGAPRRGGVG